MCSGTSFKRSSGVIFKALFLLLLLVMLRYYYGLKLYMDEVHDWLSFDGSFARGLMSYDDLVKVSPLCEDPDYLADHVYLVEIDTNYLIHDDYGYKYPVDKAVFIRLTKRNP